MGDIFTMIMPSFFISYLLLLPSFVGSHLNNKVISETFHNVLATAQDFIGNLQDFVGDKNGCQFICPPGLIPKRNPHHIPSSNGCGAFGIQFDSEVSVKSVSKCCDKHDICYDTCNNKKTDCDKAFKSCLGAVCEKVKKTVPKSFYKGCISTADVLYAGTVALGCKPYKDAQEKACVCRRKQEL